MTHPSTLLSVPAAALGNRIDYAFRGQIRVGRGFPWDMIKAVNSLIAVTNSSLPLFWFLGGPRRGLVKRLSSPLLFQKSLTYFMQGLPILHIGSRFHSATNGNVTVELSEMSEKLSEKSEMCETTWASEVMRKQIAPASDGKNVGSRIRDCAQKLRWNFSRTKDVWYRDERVSLKPRELRRIEEVTGIEYGQRELKEVDALIAKADNLLMGNDTDFHSAFIAAVREIAGLANRTGTKG